MIRGSRPDIVGPVVAVLAGPAQGRRTADLAAQEAQRRGAALVLLVAPGPAERLLPGTGQAPAWVQRVVTDLGRQWPDLTMEVVTAPDDETRGAVVLAAPSLVVVDGAVAHTVTEVTRAARVPGSPVLVLGPGNGAHRVRRVTALLTQDATDAEVAVVAAQEVALRGGELRLVLVYQQEAQDDERAARQAHGYLADQLASMPAIAGAALSGVCSAGPADLALAQHAHDAEVLVVHAGTTALPQAWLARLLRRRPSDVLVLRGAATPPPAPAPDTRYRQALERELRAHPDRSDGCTTPAELDDAWHVGTANPPVSIDVTDAWRQLVEARSGPRGDG